MMLAFTYFFRPDATRVRCLLLISILIGLLGLTCVSEAQVGVNLTGVVKDLSGAVVAGATVKVTDQRTGLQHDQPCHTVCSHYDDGVFVVYAADDGSGKIPFERTQTETFSDISPVVISWEDYDNDGWPDLFVSYSTGVLKLFHNDHGTLHDVTASTGLADYRHRITAASWGDYDGDGNLGRDGSG